VKKEILISRDTILQRIDALARELNAYYKGKEPVVIGVLKGAFVFLADLVRRFEFPCAIDFVRLASYGSGTESKGTVTITKDLEIDIAGKDVLIVEDIVDTGITLDFLVQKLKERAPRSIAVCVLLDKYERRKVPFHADFVGFPIEDHFVLGYGLDYNEQGRSCPDICMVNLD